MNLVQPNENFGFNYTTFDQATSLFVAFSVYDSSSGSPIFLAKVPGVYTGGGAYAANYLALPGITYAVKGLVYHDSGFTSVDSSRAQFSDVYQSVQATVVSAGFTYNSYDFVSNLPIRAMIYNTTSSPVLFTTTVMIPMGDGVYYGSFSAAISENFQIIGVVYTDNTYTTPNFNYAPSSATFATIGVTPSTPVQNSTQIDVSELMHDTDFVDGISLVSRVPTVNALGENILVESTVNSYGSVQPASGKTLQRLPEALRNQDVSSFWFQGVIVATSAGQYPMVLIFKGRRYQVKNVMDWSTWGRGWTEGVCVAELPS